MAPTLELADFSDADFDLNASDVTTDKELGRGNFSHVYKGKFKDEVVAVKKQQIVDPDLERYLRLELSVLKAVETEGVIKFYGAYREGDNIVMIITEYVEGGDLRRLLCETQAPLGWKLRCEIMMRTAGALKYLHECDIIHRDIKTENVLLTSEFTPKLCDFGFARKIDRSKQMTMCGTDEYMAPEIIFGMKYDEKADVYSYGMMLVELFSRKIPSNEDFLNRLPQNGFNLDFDELDAAASASECPDSLLMLTKETLDDNPSNRPEADGVFGWLEEMCEEMPEDSEPKPNLSSSAVLATLDAYVKKQNERIEGMEGYNAANDMDEDDDFEDEEAKQKAVDALLQHNEMIARSSTAGSDILPAGPTAAGNDAAATAPASSPKTARKKSHTRSKSNASDGREYALTTTAKGDADAENPGFFGHLLSILGCLSAGPQASKIGKAAKAAPEWERMVGWVLKRGGRIKTWKKRYMVVTKLGIVYFKSPEDQKNNLPQGSIDFEEMAEVAGVVCNDVPTVLTGKAHSFGVHTLKRTYYMSTASQVDRILWTTAILDGYKAYLRGLKKKERQERRTSMAPMQGGNYAQLVKASQRSTKKIGGGGLGGISE